MFDEVVPVNESAHMFDRLFAIPQHFRADLRVEDFSYAPSFSPAAEEAARRIVCRRASPGGRILFVHPETRPDKMWSPASFSWVLERFLEAYPEFKVFVSSVEPYPLELDRARHRVVWADDHLELALAMLRHADLFLGIDSCFLHAADLFRVPGVGLFGPTDPHQWGFRLSPRPQAIWGEGSMEGIRREAVLDALLEIADDCGSESE
jgi:ADP-heptose:LPS heptosyltransferase